MNQPMQPTRKIFVFMNLTLDGVMQGPAGPDEDPRGGFQRGGWAAPYGAMQSQAAGELLPPTGALLFGRWTYESFYSFWPKQIILGSGRRLFPEGLFTKQGRECMELQLVGARQTPNGVVAASYRPAHSQEEPK